MIPVNSLHETGYLLRASTLPASDEQGREGKLVGASEREGAGER